LTVEETLARTVILLEPLPRKARSATSAAAWEEIQESVEAAEQILSEVFYLDEARAQKIFSGEMKAETPSQIDEVLSRATNVAKGAVETQERFKLVSPDSEDGIKEYEDLRGRCAWILKSTRAIAEGARRQADAAQRKAKKK